MADTGAVDPPSAFIVHWVGVLSSSMRGRRSALDVAMGRGRHALVLAQSGFRVFGTDVRYDAVVFAVERAAREGHVIRGWCADLTVFPLPRDRFDVVIVARYLQRDLFDALRAAPVPGGVVLYETFTEAQRAHGRGPTSPDHLLEAGELRDRFRGFEIVFYEETSEPEAVARIVACRR